MPFQVDTNTFIRSCDFIVGVTGMDHQFEGFTKCSAIKSKREQVTFKNGTDMFVRKMPGRAEWEDVTLERRYSGRDDFHKWWEDCLAGNIDRRSVAITFMRQDQKRDVTRYVLLSAYPTAFELPELDAESSNAAVERVTLTFERAIMQEGGEGYLVGGGHALGGG